MAKARARTAARKVKDKWRGKNWYQIKAPNLFDNMVVAETLSESPENLMGRTTEVSLQNITNDFRKSHIKLYFKINKIEDDNAFTYFKGHSLTSDYIRRMIRRRKSRIDGVYDVETKDGAYLRVKPFAITEKRIQNSQKKIIRNIMKDTVTKEGKAKTLNDFLKDTLEGKLGSEIYKNCKNIYPVKRIEIFKTEVNRLPTIIIEDEKPKEKKEETTEEEPKEKKETKKKPAKKELKEEEKPKETKKVEKKKEKKPKAKPKTKKTTVKKKETEPKTAKKSTKKAKK